MSNPFVHVELATNDLPKAKDFYSKLFSWKLRDNPDYDYTLIEPGAGPEGGMMKNPVPGLASHWMPYVQVEDVAASTEKARSLGATVCKEKTEVPGFGWFTVITDPTGAALGLWETKSSK